jgi:hypothetical protein
MTVLDLCSYLGLGAAGRIAGSISLPPTNGQPMPRLL